MVEPPQPRANEGAPEPEHGPPHQAGETEPPAERRSSWSAGVGWMVAAVVLAVAIGWIVWALAT